MKKEDYRGYEGPEDFSWAKSIITLIIFLLIIGCGVALVFHQWSDCLEENSYFTCARMLNK